MECGGWVEWGRIVEGEVGWSADVGWSAEV